MTESARTNHSEASPVAHADSVSHPDTDNAATMPVPRTRSTRREVPGRRMLAGVALAVTGLLAVGTWWLVGAPGWMGPRQHPLPDVEVVTNSVGMRFVRIGAGRFVMGADPADPVAEPDEKPAHAVELTRDFWLGQFEVTHADYERVMGTNPANFGPRGEGAPLVQGLQPGRLPVEMVSWFDAERFCLKISELPIEREAGRTYRLPTEAEWEYACRAGTSTRFNTGDRLSLDAANVKGRWQHPLPVGCYPPNPWGLFDMHGNVLEWCGDWHTPDYYAQSPVVDPPGPDVSLEDTRVLRGGGWFFKAASSSFRDAISPYFRSPAHGFRVVCELSKNDR